MTMTSVPSALAQRLNDLHAAGYIAGWQDAGGPNYGLGTEPLPALVFPLGEGVPARTCYTEPELRELVQVVETFGPLVGIST